MFYIKIGAQVSNMSTLKKTVFYSFILFLLSIKPSFSGSGLYLGGDIVSSKSALETRVTTRLVDPSAPPPTTVVEDVSNKFTNFSARIGYKYKRRLNDYFFTSPEFVLSGFDNSIIYSTNLKIGADVSDFSFYGVAGASHVNEFDKNQFNYGLGMEYKFSRIVSLNLEWQKIDTMKEITEAEILGLIVRNEKQRDVTFVKLGITVYFHE